MMPARLAVLGQRNFRLFFTGQMASVTGSSMVPVALSFAVLRSGGSAADVGFALAAETAPLVALLLVGGVIADWFPRRRVMQAADILRCGSEALMAGLLAAGPAPLWSIMALAAVLGVGLAFSGPAVNALLSEIVADEWLQDANALSGMAFATGIIVGPGVAGGLVAAFGPAPAFGLDAASFAVSAFCLARLELDASGAGGSERFLSRLIAGWQEFRSHTWLWVIVLQWSFYQALVYAPFLALGAVVSDRSYGGAAAWGAILTVYGLGALAGDVLALHVHPRRPMFAATIATMAWSLPTAALALKLAVPVVAATAFVTGIGMALFITIWHTTLQREVKPEALARVSAYDWFGSNLLIPAGYALIGPLSGLIGVSGVLALAAAWQLVSSLLVLAAPGVRSLQARDSEPVWPG